MRFENLVAAHLLKLAHWQQDTRGAAVDLHYLRTKDGTEVDFALSEGDTLCQTMAPSPGRSVAARMQGRGRLRSDSTPERSALAGSAGGLNPNTPSQCPLANSAAFPPAAVVFTVTVCSAQKRYR